MLYSIRALAAFALLSGCATSGLQHSSSNQQNLFSQYEAMNTARLWTLHYVTSAPRELAFLEAELGSRGETHYGTDYLGRNTYSSVGRALYSRVAVAADTLNCSDFTSTAAAQKFFLSAGGPMSDPHGLDRDGDGLACEWGTTIRRIRTTYSISRYPTYHSSGICHVGPRGGTYTITASGNKNYSGC
jgi:hypothetical protein